MTTRSKAGIHKPKVYTADVSLLDSEPSNVKTALQSPHWLQAMQEEYNALLANKTWSLVPLPSNGKPIGCKWVFKVKRKPDGSVSKYKARLVAQGFHQR